jgi:hypothetical protein
MKNLVLALLFCLGFCCLSCDKASDLEPQGVVIRVRNASSYPFETVYVNTSGGENNYGPLAAGKSTQYLGNYTKAYRYANIKVVIAGQELVLQPFDYVGETPLTPGNYTYVIGVTDLARKQLSLQFENQ